MAKDDEPPVLPTNSGVPPDPASGEGSGSSSSWRPSSAGRRELPATIGRYEVRARLGKGGQATVYLGWDPVLQVERALKVLHREGDYDFADRLVAEARTMIRLDHPNIVRVFDILPEIPCIVMEYCDGGDLEGMLKGRVSLPLGDLLDIVEQVAAGLAAAHGREEPVIHRDLKPANILFKDGRPKITDFGLAKVRGEGGDHGSTSSGILPGTTNYMAPEQITSPREIDRRIDLWALGVILHEMLTWRRPFERAGESPYLVLKRILEEPVPDPPWDVPAPLWKVVLRALEKDRDRRYQAAEEFLADVRAARERIDDPGRLVPPLDVAREEDLLAQLVFGALRDGELDLARERASRLRREFPGSDLGRYWYNMTRSSSSVSRPLFTGSGSAASRSAVARARRLLDEGRLDEAGVVLEEQLARHPADRRARELLREVEERRREEQDLRRRVDEALQEAGRLARAGELARAVELLEALGPGGQRDPRVADSLRDLRLRWEEATAETGRQRARLREDLRSLERRLGALGRSLPPGAARELLAELESLRAVVERAEDPDEIGRAGRRLLDLGERAARAAAEERARRLAEIAGLVARARAGLSMPGVDRPELARLAGELYELAASGSPVPAGRVEEMLRSAPGSGEPGRAAGAAELRVDPSVILEGIRGLVRRCAGEAGPALAPGTRERLAELEDWITTREPLAGERLARVLRRWAELELAVAEARRAAAGEERRRREAALDVLSRGPDRELLRAVAGGQPVTEELRLAATTRAEGRAEGVEKRWRPLAVRLRKLPPDREIARLADRVDRCVRSGAWAGAERALAALAARLGEVEADGGNDEALREVLEELTEALARAGAGEDRGRELEALGRELLRGDAERAVRRARELLAAAGDGATRVVRPPGRAVRRATRRFLPETWAAWERLATRWRQEGHRLPPAERQRLLEEMAAVRRRMVCPPPRWPRVAAIAATLLATVVGGVYGWQAQRREVPRAASAATAVRLVVTPERVATERLPAGDGARPDTVPVSFPAGGPLPDPRAVDAWVGGED